jgi:ATP-dependent DNA helicase RecG
MPFRLTHTKATTRNAMASSVEKLGKMIALEIEEGYNNKAVIGGLGGVLGWWPDQARRECTSAEQGALIDEIVDLVQGYETLDGQDARAHTIAQIKVKLADLASPPAPRAVPSPEPHPSQPRAAGAPVPEATDYLTNHDLAHQGLDSPVTAISGIGPTQAKRLKRLGVETIGALLYLFPRRHEDYSQLKPIAKLRYGDQVTVIGTIRSTRLKRQRGGAAIVNSIIADGSGSIQATWFNQPYLVDQFKRGRQIVLSGTVDEYLGRLVMTSPVWEPLDAELLHTNRLVPVYPLTGGIKARWLRRIMKRTVDYWTKRLPDHLPSPIRERNDLLPLEVAVRQMHFPDSVQELACAHRRLAFDEFFLLQIGVLRQRREWRSHPGVPVPVDQAVLQEFLSGLPYQLTGAQRQALDDILGDLESDRPMSRLLQGDVGSGKTVVAVAAMYLAAKGGYQSAMMAPTEILAEQHFNNVTEMLGRHGVSVALLTGSVSRSEREAIYAEVASGEVQVLVGTHALIQEGVEFRNLALATVDEQHRFGVRQRGALRAKGYNPHILVMSATPIPRTLALTAYGDLDLSVIDEMPPGRQPIQTRWFMPAERERAYRFVRAQIEEGRQAYIICPLVEESEKIEAKAAVEEHDRLSKSIFPDLRLGLLHGRLKGTEKEEVMRAFAERELDILVSTSVVEVGIDVPNATVMLIEGANRFGLSQLHQFRGRVGRGQHKSFCILLSDTTTDVSEERLRAIEDTQDGFKLAERDLEMRGPGDFFGTRQSGLPELKLASLGDTLLLELARREAQSLFAEDSSLSHPDHRLLVRKVNQFWGGEGDLS